VTRFVSLSLACSPFSFYILVKYLRADIFFTVDAVLKGHCDSGLLKVLLDLSHESLLLGEITEMFVFKHDMIKQFIKNLKE
jgi:hypothetical protein